MPLRRRNSKKNISYYDQMKMDKKKKKQNTTQETKERGPRIPLQDGNEFRNSGKVSSSYYTSVNVTWK